MRGGNQARGGAADDRSRGSHTSGSDQISSSSCEGVGGSGIGTPSRPPTVGCEKDHDDLYNWMVRQQEYTHANDGTKPTVTFPHVSILSVRKLSFIISAIVYFFSHYI